MKPRYIGHVSHSDPVFDYFRNEIQPQIKNVLSADYRVFKMNGSNDVYLYEERSTNTKFIGKFFASSGHMEREYNNLGMMRNFGFDSGPHYIARPLGRNPYINDLLVTEYCQGELLSDVINNAIQNHNYGHLYYRLTGLAYFLSKFHNRTAENVNVDFADTSYYMDMLINRLRNQQLIDQGEADWFYYLRNRWHDYPSMWEDRQVIVHGDATPENFLFGDGLNVMSYDLERLRHADRVYDVGRIAAELGHFFMLNTNNRYRAEPFIGHFLWEYSCHFPDRENTFRAISKRVPYYMGINFLRIARNSWLTWDYSKKLIYEAKQCLEEVWRK